jgi:hypothetical protein
MRFLVNKIGIIWSESGGFQSDDVESDVVVAIVKLLGAEGKQVNARLDRARQIIDECVLYT